MVICDDVGGRYELWLGNHQHDEGRGGEEPRASGTARILHIVPPETSYSQETALHRVLDGRRHDLLKHEPSVCMEVSLIMADVLKAFRPALHNHINVLTPLTMLTRALTIIMIASPFVVTPRGAESSDVQKVGQSRARLRA